MGKQKPQKPAKKAPRQLGAPPPIVTARSDVTRKLDLACGQNTRDGFDGVDIWPGAKHVVDLSVYPWPFEDNSVLELHSSHYIEHIEMGMVDDKGNPCRQGHPGAKDSLLKFFDECYRILVPEGWLTVICPCARSNRAFQDPTHRRFIVAETFAYLWAEWRSGNKLDHYNVQCDFGANVGSTVAAELNLRSSDVQQLQMNSYWNAVHDWVAKLQAFKPARTPTAPVKS